MKTRPRITRTKGLILVAVLFLLGAVSSVAVTQSRALPLQTIKARLADNPSPPLDRALPHGFSSVIKPAARAVVSIISSRIVRVRNTDPFLQDPLFQQFFGDSFPQFQTPHKRREQGLGSGIIVDSNGYILTNNHVVEGGEKIQVFLSNKRKLRAEIIGTDPKTDLALLKVEAEDLPALSLGDSGKLEVGDLVFAIGNPYGIGQTVTMGIVSATSRGNLGIEDYEDFIQTDAAINPGNSGGALINTQGELVGINTAIIGRSGGSDGLGFAIPADMARHVVNQLRLHGKVSRGLIGAMLQDLTPEMASVFDLREAQGALVADLQPGGPAEKSGLQRGDVIVALDRKAVPDSRRLRLWIAELAPGTEVELAIIRSGNEMKIPIKLDELAENSQSGPRAQSSEDSSLRGLDIQSLTPEIRRSLDLPADSQGVVVSGVEPGSAAARAGLQRGDVIQEINRTPVTNGQEFEKELRSSADNRILLLVNRGGNTMFLFVE